MAEESSEEEVEETRSRSQENLLDGGSEIFSETQLDARCLVSPIIETAPRVEGRPPIHQDVSVEDLQGIMCGALVPSPIVASPMDFQDASFNPFPQQENDATEPPVTSPVESSQGRLSVSRSQRIPGGDDIDYKE